jgi:hypothetical protein
MYRVIFLFFSFYIPVISQCEHFWIFLPFLELGVAYTEHIRIPEHKQVDSLMFILLLIGEVLKFDRLMGPEIPDSKEVVQFPSLLLLASHD